MLSTWLKIAMSTSRNMPSRTNHAFDPTAGSLQDVSVEVAGLGGERFAKAEARERWYYTFLRTKALGDFTYSLGATAGYGFGNEGLNGQDLPLFERYFPGGINSIRGFKSRTLGPREENKDQFGRVTATTPMARGRMPAPSPSTHSTTVKEEVGGISGLPPPSRYPCCR